MEEHNLVTLFNAYTEMDNPPTLALLNKDKVPIGALYMDKLKYKQFVVSETNNSEKYYLYVDGIGIYFSYFTKIHS